MFSTIDSQPQEWLLNKPNELHTLAFCCFRDDDHARQWIHSLIPKDKNGKLLKWSHDGREKRTHSRRLEFTDKVESAYSSIDFEVHCISSTESQISLFAQAFYLENLKNIHQEVDRKGRNCLVFKISEDSRPVSMPALRAAKLIWIFYCIKYMREQKNLDGCIFSDWFSCDATAGETRALGVAMVNLWLRNTGLQVSIAKDPRQGEADLLSDWFAGWSNSTNGGSRDSELGRRFKALTDRTSPKVDFVSFQVLLSFVGQAPQAQTEGPAVH